MEWISTKDAGERLGVTATRVRQYITEGRLRTQKFGPAYMVDSDSVDEFERQTRGRKPSKKRKRGGR
jgi:excisionase family DNA binding protein